MGIPQAEIGKKETKLKFSLLKKYSILNKFEIGKTSNVSNNTKFTHMKKTWIEMKFTWNPFFRLKTFKTNTREKQKITVLHISNISSKSSTHNRKKYISKLPCEGAYFAHEKFQDHFINKLSWRLILYMNYKFAKLRETWLSISKHFTFTPRRK